MLRSPVNATSVPESVSDVGQDELVRGDPSETYSPNNWICSLVITGTDGRQYYGSGFKIHIPNINRCIVVTSGHCVYVNGALADNITVTFPGQAAVTATQADMYASPEYITYKSNDHDYGFIILPGDSNEGFGWSAIVPDDELSHSVMCQFISGREISKVSPNRLYYTNDTMGDLSGSPVYMWYKGCKTVVGVHSRGSLNSAPKVTSEMIYRLFKFKNIINSKKYSLQSSKFTGVYIRCDGRDVTAKADRGSGVINCQYGSGDHGWETFYIYPVEVSSSLAQEQMYIVVLQNYQYPNALVRLDGSDMNKYENEGGGVVNCQWSGEPTASNYPVISSWESFVLKEEQGGYYSLQSVQWPNCYIRLDGTGVTSHLNEGGGIVNCQFYGPNSEKKGPTFWELFCLEPKLEQ